MGALPIKSSLDLMLALLFAKGHENKEGEPIRDTTRFVKLLFLLVREGGFQYLSPQFSFEAHDYGPWASEIFDGIESLKQIGVIETRTELPESAEELVDDRELMREFEGTVSEDTMKITIYSLSKRGLVIGQNIFECLSDVEKQCIIDIKRKFNHISLSELLEYVYNKYPETTLKSKIKEKVRKLSMFGCTPDLPTFEREEEDLRT